MTRRLDAGPILHQRVTPLSGSETAGVLADRLAHTGAADLPAVVEGWLTGEIQTVPQDESLASYTRELQKSDGEIDWSAPALQTERFVRAMDPWPRAWTTFRGQLLSILAARHATSASARRPGELAVENDSVTVVTGAGKLELVVVQPAGKRTMPAVDWARGARLTAGERLGDPQS